MRRDLGIWLAAAALAALLWCGCSAMLAEKTKENDDTGRVRVTSGDKWSNYDHSSGKENDMSIMLKSEQKF